MKERTVTGRQFIAAVYTALLSPLFRLLPRASAVLAGRAAFLCVLPALPVLLVLIALMRSLRRRTRPGEGMADVILRLFGPVFGRLLLVLYGAWFLFYAGFILRSGAERLTAAVYQRSGGDPFVLVLLALCLAGALGTLRAASRTGAVLRVVLPAALVFVAVLALPNLSADNLLPLRWPDIRGVLPGAWPIASVGGAAALFSFLGAYVEPDGLPDGRLLRPLFAFLAVAAVLCFETVGTFGAALTARLSYPFFTMIRDVSLLELNQRIEAVVIALWVLADFILCTLLLRCAHEALRTVFRLPKPEGEPFFSLRRGRWLLWLQAAAVYGCSRLVPLETDRFFHWSQTLVPLLSDAFVFGGFTLIWLVSRLRKDESAVR